MYGKIIDIEEVHSIEPSKEDYNTYVGYRVQTDKTKALVLVSDGQSCCENFGYITTNDDLKEFLGAEVLKIEVVDTALRKHDAIEYMDEGEIMFVNFETDRGTLQLAVYNSHNGYYGHTAKLIIGEEAVKERYL